MKTETLKKTNDSNDSDEVEMEIFRSGDYGAKGAYTPDDLQRIADDYQPGLLEAPLTFDHAQSGPAYGWVSRLRREGNRMVAVLKGVPQSVKDLVRSGAYKRRSVELFRIMPQTGRPYLRAVSLLGAATPEVKGLRDICFSATADSTPDLITVPVRDEVEDLRGQLLENRLALLFSELRADGYCLPDRDAQGIRHIFDSHQGSVRFDDGTAQQSLDWMGSFLRQHLLKAPLGEAARAAHQAHAVPAPHTRFSERTDQRSLTLHHGALQIQASQPGLSYRDALTSAAKVAGASCP